MAKKKITKVGFPETPIVDNASSPVQNPGSNPARTSPRELSSGTFAGVMKVKGTIIINDGTNDRILIGFQEDGF